MRTNQNKLTIRTATASDLNQLLPLLSQLGYPQTIQELEKQFKLFASQQDYGVAIAVNENKIVGMVAWSKSILFVSQTTRIHIEGLVVDDASRGEGVGKALMQYVENAAKQYSPCIVDLTSGLRREQDGSHEFYKALGYSNEGYMAKLYLRKKIE